jgi:tripartite-type tricarboxylate transporter receptor subunit TctC
VFRLFHTPTSTGLNSASTSSDSPSRSAADLIGEIRKNPGKLNFSTAGVSTSQNMAAQYFMTLAGLTKDHAVGIHYKGGGEVTAAVLGGQVNFACNNAPTGLGVELPELAGFAQFFQR